MEFLTGLMGGNETDNKQGGKKPKTRKDLLIEVSKRSFTVESASGITIPTDASMRYLSRTPFAAAAKATKRLYKLADKQKKKPKQIRFVLRETTQGTGSKTFTYIGVREKYEKPIVVSLNGKQVTYKHFYNVKSCVKQEK